MTLKLKGGAYVDPESGLEDKAHVYKSGEDLYSVVLGSVDVQEGRNSYYKLQLLQHDTKAHKYVLGRLLRRKVCYICSFVYFVDYREKFNLLFEGTSFIQVPRFNQGTRNCFLHICCKFISMHYC